MIIVNTDNMRIVGGMNIKSIEDFCRTLTQGEQEIGQTLPVGYTKCLSYNQASDVIGNCWTVDVIVHILKGLEQ